MDITKLVCIGDSLTEGYDIEQQHRWTTLLEKEMPFPIINSGISGDTTGGMLARFQQMVIAHYPSHVLILGGTNDIRHGLAVQQILSNIIAMTRQARYQQIDAIIGIPPPFYFQETVLAKTTYLDHRLVADRIAQLQHTMRYFAKEEAFPVINFDKDMTFDLFLPDGLHPNERGQVVMKENAALVLRGQ